jgi:translation initiation factor 3 subunit I
VTEKRSGHLSTIVVYEINPDPEAKQSDEQVLRIVCDESKATVAGFSYLAKYIISGHEDGSITQWDGKTGELLSSNYDVHEPDISVWTIDGINSRQLPTSSGRLTEHTSSPLPRTRPPR